MSSVSLTTYLACNIEKDTNTETLRVVVRIRCPNAGDTVSGTQLLSFNVFFFLGNHNPTVWGQSFGPWPLLPTWVSVFLSSIIKEWFALSGE